jgi:hypothetical protein
MTSIGPALGGHHRNSGREILVVIVERMSSTVGYRSGEFQGPKRGVGRVTPIRAKLA